MFDIPLVIVLVDLIRQAGHGGDDTAAEVESFGLRILGRNRRHGRGAGKGLFVKEGVCHC